MDLYQFKNAAFEVQVRRIAHGAYVIMQRFPEMQWKTIRQFSTGTAANRSAKRFVRGCLRTPTDDNVKDIIVELIKAGILDARTVVT